MCTDGMDENNFEWYGMVTCGLRIGERWLGWRGHGKRYFYCYFLVCNVLSGEPLLLGLYASVFLLLITSVAVLPQMPYPSMIDIADFCIPQLRYDAGSKAHPIAE